MRLPWVDPWGLMTGVEEGAFGGTIICGPVCGAIGAIAGGTAVFFAGQSIIEHVKADRSDNKCEEDPCKQHEKVCVGTAKAVEKHNYGTSSQSPHMHPGICDNLADKINKADAAGCGGKPGVVYAKGVYNTAAIPGLG